MLKEEASRGDSEEKFLGNTVLSQNGDNCAFVRHRVNPFMHNTSTATRVQQCSLSAVVVPAPILYTVGL